MYCYKCGKQINQTDAFCPFCGGQQTINPSSMLQTPQETEQQAAWEQPSVNTILPTTMGNDGGSTESYPTSVAAVTTAATKTAGTAVKTGIPLATKIVMIVAAVAIAIGGGTTAWFLLRNEPTPTSSPPSPMPSEIVNPGDDPKPTYTSQEREGGFTPGPVVYLDGYTYYTETALGALTEISVSTYELDRICRVADAEGSNPEVVYISRNHSNMIDGSAIPSMLSLFLWRGEIWFFEREDNWVERQRRYENGEEYVNSSEFYLRRIDKKTGNAELVTLNERDGEFVRFSEPDDERGRKPLMAGDHGMLNIGPFGAYGDIVFCSVGFSDGSLNTYIIAINVDTGEVTQIDRDLHSGDVIAPIGVYNGWIYYLRSFQFSTPVKDEISICGQEIDQHLSKNKEKAFATINTESDDLLTTRALIGIIYASKSYSNPLYYVMKDGAFYFLSDYVQRYSPVNVLMFSAKTHSLSSIAEIDEENEYGDYMWMASPYVTAQGENAFSACNYRPDFGVVNRHDSMNGKSERIVESDNLVAVYGATERFLYYLRRDADSNWALCRVDYTRDSPNPEVLKHIEIEG